MRHIDLKDVSIEGQLRDSQRAGVLAEFAVATRKEKHPETWHHLVKACNNGSSQLDGDLRRLRTGGVETVPCR
jgi:hypothetical protein